MPTNPTIAEKRYYRVTENNQGVLSIYFFAWLSHLAYILLFFLALLSKRNPDRTIQIKLFVSVELVKQDSSISHLVAHCAPMCRNQKMT